MIRLEAILLLQDPYQLRCIAHTTAARSRSRHAPERFVRNVRRGPSESRRSSRRSIARFGGIGCAALKTQ